MTVNYVLTFEFDSAPQLVHRGTASATSMPTILARAGKAAMKAHPGAHWTSLNLVLLERVAEKPQTERSENPQAEAVEG